ncbi:exosortase family protein XrtF [Aestuariivivens sediminis]|uniref:exosortase family protein XrtF n=1 Tax=Aestuariivivens sediminis TaxID=2913557 RepID=UPI001F5A270E|nr:exosortase family protein XrtF [Aestuariivivens sediminis]
MKKLLLKYKWVIRFILTFLLVYVLLSLSYKFYLDFSKNSKFYPDYVTNLVAKQTEHLLNDFGYEARVEPHPNEPSMKLIINHKYVARVLEGCNAVSVIILFISFIVAFSGRFRETLVYALSGSVLIYVVNLFRIVILSIGLYHYPWRKEILHTVIFPAIIYGMVFLLWMIWVNYFALINKKHGEER